MENHLQNSIFAVAPERNPDLIDNYDLIYLGERKWELYAVPTDSTIFISRGAIELLWCSSLAHFLFYTRAVQGKRFDVAGEIDLRVDPRIRDSLDLLRWALKCHLGGDNADDWPRQLPRPLQAPTKESDENVADELCLVSSAYLLHHELAHVRLRHRADVDDALSLQQEKEADIAAAEWILDGIAEDDPRFIKRMLGIVQAFLLTTAYGLYGGTLGGKRHPFSYDRLSSILSRFLGTNNHVAKGYAYAVLSLHFQNSGRQLARQRFQDFEEALDTICNNLANEACSRSRVATA